MTSFDLGRFKANLFWHIIDIAASLNKTSAKLYEHYIGRQYIIEKNIFLKNINKKILHIGCGAYPVTAISLAKNSNAQITAIDNNPIIANIAKDVIRKKNNPYNSSINIERGDGATFPVQDFDVIIVSSCSIPKEKILRHVFEQASSNTIIIVRELDEEIPLSNKFVQNYQDIKLINSIRCHAVLNLRWRSSFFLKK